MNVYRLKPIGIYGGGMALVAAPSFDFAKDVYLKKGIYGEKYWFREFDFDDRYPEPIKGLEWHGEACVICDNMYFE